MHRIDTNGSVAGAFSNGNPGLGQPATLVDADWLNAVQENIIYPIAQAGIGLVKGNNAQLYNAMTALIAGVVGSGGGAVPTTRNVLGGGLVTGGGTLAADRTLTVTAATSGQIQAGTSTTTAITPAGLAAALTGLVAANDYMKLPDGRILQHGVTAMGGGSNVVTGSIVFPIAFPTVCYEVFAQPDGPPNGGWSAITSYCDSLSTSGCNVRFDSANSGQVINGGRNARWWAIGR